MRDEPIVDLVSWCLCVSVCKALALPIVKAIDLSLDSLLELQTQESDGP